MTKKVWVLPMILYNVSVTIQIVVKWWNPCVKLEIFWRHQCECVFIATDNWNMFVNTDKPSVAAAHDVNIAASQSH